MQICVMIWNGHAGWGIIGMNNVIKLLPKLVGARTTSFYLGLAKILTQGNEEALGLVC